MGTSDQLTILDSKQTYTNNLRENSFNTLREFWILRCTPLNWNTCKSHLYFVKILDIIILLLLCGNKVTDKLGRVQPLSDRTNFGDVISIAGFTICLTSDENVRVAFICVRWSKHSLFAFAALVLLVRGPLVPLTRPGLSLCPLFTVTVIRPMEAQQRGVCSHCPVQDCQPLFGHKLSQGLRGWKRGCGRS